MRPARNLAAVVLAVVMLGACSAAPPAGPSTAPNEATETPSLAPNPSPTPLPSPSASPSASTSLAPSAIAGSSPVPGAVWVAGTHVSMAPPPGFEPATEGPGFRDTASDAVISIQELPGGPFDLTDRAFAQSGFHVDDRVRTTLDGQSRLLVTGEQVLPDGTRVRGILLSQGTDAMSTLVIAQHALGDAGAHTSILAALETVRVDPTRAIEPGVAIAFDVTPTPPLHLAGMLGQGATYNTLGRKHHPLDAAIPTMNLYVYPEPPPEDAAIYLRDQLDRNGQQLFDPKILLEAGVIIDDLEGFQIVASALDALEQAPGDRELFVYQVFLPGPDADRYAYMEAIATADVRDELLPAFRDTALSFRWREAP